MNAPKRDTTVDLRFLHRTGNNIASAESWENIFAQVVDFATRLVPCNSTFVYVLEGGELTLKAMKGPSAQPASEPQISQELLQLLSTQLLPVVSSQGDSRYPHYEALNGWLPREQPEGFLAIPLVCQKQLVGILYVDFRGRPHVLSVPDLTLLSTVGFLLGSEIGRAQLAATNVELSERLETRKLVERAKGILQRDLGLSEEQAYLTLQRHSRQKRKPLREIAEAVLLNDSLKRGHRSDTAARA